MDETGTPTTLIEAVRYFADKNVSLDYVVSRRWPNGVECPRCGSKKVHFLANQLRWKCSNPHAQRQFSAKVGTIFEDSAIGFEKWLPAMWMLANCKNGISSHELGRALGVTQRTAWFMLQRIRYAMKVGSFTGPMAGKIEVDETFIGGKARFMHADKRREKIKGTGPLGKIAVMGLLARHGNDGHSVVRATVVTDRKKATLQGKVRKHVAPGSIRMSFRRTSDCPTTTCTTSSTTPSATRRTRCTRTGWRTSGHS